MLFDPNINVYPRKSATISPKYWGNSTESSTEVFSNIRDNHAHYTLVHLL